MDRLFLDANVLFSAAYRPDSGLLVFWKHRNVTLCSSRYALEEARINLPDRGQVQRLDGLSLALTFYDGFGYAMPKRVTLPEKDVPILLAALAAKADYLLTGDIRHFGSYFEKKIEGVPILLPADYLKLRDRDR